MTQTTETLLQPLKPGDLETLASVTANPSVSIILPTHRTGREMTQDPIRLKNLLTEVTEQFKKDGHDTALLEPIHAATRSTAFWQHQGDGLAIYATPNECQMFRLNRTPEEATLIADQFLLTPIVKQQGAAGQFFVLALTWDEAKLMRGGALSLELVETESLPAKFHDLVLPRDPEESLQNTSHRNVGNVSGKHTAMFHGQGEGEDKIEADRSQYLSLVGDEVAAAIYNTGVPLMIVATAEVAGHFESRTGIEVDLKLEGSPSQWSQAELQSHVGETIGSYQKTDPADLKERFGTALSRGLASGDLVDITGAAEERRIDVLMIRHDQTSCPETNAAAIATLQGGGQVLLCETDSMPSPHDKVAGIFRF